jgi:hypothetical protein
VSSINVHGKKTTRYTIGAMMWSITSSMLSGCQGSRGADGWVEPGAADVDLDLALVSSSAMARATIKALGVLVRSCREPEVDDGQ